MTESPPRILNAAINAPAHSTPTATPQVEVLDVYGHDLLFDVNSLTVAEVPAAVAAAVRADPTLAARFGGILYSRHQPQFPLRTHAGAAKLTLLLTYACNLACAYCFARQDASTPSTPSTPSTMSMAVARRALDILPGNLDLCFFGGEPTLAWDRLVEITQEARNRAVRGRRLRLHLTTNGTLIDAQRATWLREQGVSVLVSLDGPPDVHNANRPACGTAAPGCDSHSQTVAGIKHLAAAGIRPGLRATFSDPDVNLARLMIYFRGLIDNGLASYVSIEPAVLSEGCGTAAMPGMERLAARYHEAAQVYVERPFKFAPFEKLLARLLYTRHMPSECGAGVGYLTVAPDGVIHACHKSGCPVGHVNHGVDEAARAPWTDNRLYNRGGCMSCPWRWLCGGGCRHHRLALGGSITAPSAVLCAHREMLVRSALWIMAALGPDQLRGFIK